MAVEATAEAAGSMAAVEEDFTVVASPGVGAAHLVAGHLADRIAPRLPRLVPREAVPTYGPAEIPIVHLRQILGHPLEIQGRQTRAVDARPAGTARRRH